MTQDYRDSVVDRLLSFDSFGWRSFLMQLASGSAEPEFRLSVNPSDDIVSAARVLFSRLSYRTRIQISEALESIFTEIDLLPVEAQIRLTALAGITEGGDFLLPLVASSQLSLEVKLQSLASYLSSCERPDLESIGELDLVHYPDFLVPLFSYFCSRDCDFCISLLMRSPNPPKHKALLAYPFKIFWKEVSAQARTASALRRIIVLLPKWCQEIASELLVSLEVPSVYAQILAEEGAKQQINNFLDGTEEYIDTIDSKEEIVSYVADVAGSVTPVKLEDTSYLRRLVQLIDRFPSPASAAALVAIIEYSEGRSGGAFRDLVGLILGTLGDCLCQVAVLEALNASSVLDRLQATLRRLIADAEFSELAFRLLISHASSSANQVRALVYALNEGPRPRSSLYVRIAKQRLGLEGLRFILPDIIAQIRSGNRAPELLAVFYDAVPFFAEEYGHLFGSDQELLDVQSRSLRLGGSFDAFVRATLN